MSKTIFQAIQSLEESTGKLLKDVKENNQTTLNSQQEKIKSLEKKIQKIYFWKIICFITFAFNIILFCFFAYVFFLASQEPDYLVELENQKQKIQNLEQKRACQN
jgi:septation ring formation regulator EzrA